jgi:3-deoxy-manno-octulosonate cytidylyltransferase (CMP-KDO synthetase)
MTDPAHPSGTDRCAEVIGIIGSKPDYVINIQGDEPFIDPQQIKALADVLDGKTEIATLIKRAKRIDEVTDVASAKVVVNQSSEAIYFSRSAIPFVRNFEQQDWLQHADFYIHLGLYAYRTDVLMSISKLPEGKLEIAEKLEQLRWIEAGYKIKTVLTEGDNLSVDRPEDAVKAEAFAAKWGY